jgi:hypothetical protein
MNKKEKMIISITKMILPTTHPETFRYRSVNEDLVKLNLKTLATIKCCISILKRDGNESIYGTDAEQRGF